ncbi:MAG: hypothetical protein DRJ65_13705 [Acidobacteria bacterium]|nr:MAG: hypothetical protein DRJ65_13705 [Acidobacteriota bacterium]
MAEILFTVVFKGAIAKGHTAEKVQTTLVSAGLIRKGQLESALKGQSLMMKDLPREKALKLLEAFESAGALCEIEVQRPPAMSSPQEPPPLRPPQRSAQRPPSRVGERSEQSPTNRPSAQPDPATQLDPTPSNQESITCAKCGAIQPRGVECVKCGVFFDKIETITQLANDPDKIAREIIENYRPLLRSAAVSLVPAIPHETAARVLRPYLDPRANWEDGEEFIINMDEELIATFDSAEATESLSSNLLLTNLKLMVFRRTDEPVCAGFDLWSIKQLVLVGEKQNFLVVDEKTVELPIVPPDQQKIRKTFIKMTSEIVRALKQADRAARLKAKQAWQTDPHRSSMPVSGGVSGIGPRKGRMTLESLDLRDLVPAPQITEAAKDPAPGGGSLLSGVKGIFKKK